MYHSPYYGDSQDKTSNFGSSHVRLEPLAWVSNVPQEFPAVRRRRYQVSSSVLCLGT